MTSSGSILGNRVTRIEDPRFLTGNGTYIDNLRLEGALHVAFVRSSGAHGRIVSIDTSEAVAATGVVAVYTDADLGLAPLGPPMSMFPAAMTRALLAKDTVRYVGEPIVAVIAVSKAAAVDAAELVIVDVEPLEAVVSPAEARGGSVILHEAAETNVAFAIAGAASADLLEGCAHVVHIDIEQTRMATTPIEPRAVAATIDSEGRLVHWACSQNGHSVKDTLCKVLGLDRSAVHVIVPDVGGGFGAKSGNHVEEIFVAWAALRLRRPVRYTETRTESMQNLGHGRAQSQRITLGADAEGLLRAYRLEVVQDGGAHASIGSMLPFMTNLMASGTYVIAKVEVDTISVLTNTSPTVAYRGAGRPEATAAIERGMDVLAQQMGLDPAEIRRRNLVPREAFPYKTAVGTTYDSGDYSAALDLLLVEAGYDELRAEQARRRAAGDVKLLGIGMSTYVEVTNPMNSPEWGSVEITDDGGAIVRVGTSAHGQGHHTTFGMVLNDITGIPIEKIMFVQGDTDLVARGNGTGGSRSLQTAGVAVHEAGTQVVVSARERAAELLEAAVEDVMVDTTSGRFHVVGVPDRAIGWSDVARAARSVGSVLLADVKTQPSAPTFPFGAHLSVVEVDAETGFVTPLRHICVDDAGRIVNPLIVDGQVHGGAVAGISTSLYEEFVYDEEGNPLTSTLAEYAIPSAAELPSIERITMETYTPLNVLGVKGIGEAGTIGAAPAVQNAVVDALAHLGVRHVDIPCTPQRVWVAMQKVSAP